MIANLSKNHDVQAAIIRHSIPAEQVHLWKLYYDLKKYDLKKNEKIDIDQNYLISAKTNGFAFISHLTSCVLDDAKKIEELCTINKPSYLGKEFLISSAIKYNSEDCFDYFLNNAEFAPILKNKNRDFFSDAAYNKKYVIARKIASSKNFNINVRNGGSYTRTILDDYIGSENIVEILKECGAKTGRELDQASPAYCTVL